MGYEWLALAAAFLWAVGSILSVEPAKYLGTFSYSRWRMGCTSITLTFIAWISGGWSTISGENIFPMMLSGFIGIFIGDTALFACFNRMGPRQAGLLFSCHAVFSAVIGYFLFNETMTSKELLGAVLVFSGVVTAIFFRKKGAEHKLDALSGSLWLGVILGLVAALCQALGGIIAKPVMITSVDPIAASALRMIAAFSAHMLLFLSRSRIARGHRSITLRVFSITFLNAFLAMVLGMTLILYALKDGNVGMVALLSSTTPIMLLPILWFYSGQTPNRYAWAGAIVAVIGTGTLVY
ncbi:DMT family transporter [Vibrio salinus]|uniref:DMT family transporter n=1 Tax=Vibrio salinus TaxID=2899784 RepID=UPI001E5144E7|nr:DMT family transporter [Vibrio salinus]MCE0493498.1 DMT family transporter [Vibrio salinus]